MSTRAAGGADLLADEQHRRLVEFALPDHHRAVDRQVVQLAPHGIDRRLIGAVLVATPPQACRIDRRALGHPHNLERENALKNETVRNGDRSHDGFPAIRRARGD